MKSTISSSLEEGAEVSLARYVPPSPMLPECVQGPRRDQRFCAACVPVGPQGFDEKPTLDSEVTRTLHSCSVEWRESIHLFLTVLQCREAPLGAKVVLIEITDSLGCTCVNVGKSLS